jgi:two-component system, OmpR family, sensor kinase
MKMSLSNWSLRNRLLLATVTIAAIGIGASDFAANTALRSYLIKQVDIQLQSITDNSLARLDRAGIDSITQSDEQQIFRPVRPLRNVPTSTVVTLLDLKGNTVGTLGGEITKSTGNAFAFLNSERVQAANGVPFTLKAKKGDEESGDIRAIAKMLPSGLGSVVISTSLSGVESTQRQLSGFFFLITLIVLLLIALVARWIIRFSLRPLREIENTAAAIADGDYSARLPDADEGTEVGRLSASLNTMLSRIEESFALRTASESRLRRFVADASHELRTPLTAIRGFAELHRQGAVSGEEKTKELVGRIENESIRMSSLVEDLLLLARIDQAPQFNKQAVDLNAVINDCVASARAAGPDHQISIIAKDDENYVLGDETRIHQAVQNLLANARTHTPAGTSITITVEASDVETTVAVHDDGPGLDSQTQEKIFERFFRADPSRARTSGEGSGLGLSIVDAIMKAHGGSVSVNSALGKGSTFTLHFPTAKD